jgi:hypothetical protein
MVRFSSLQVTVGSIISHPQMTEARIQKRGAGLSESRLSTCPGISRIVVNKATEHPL